MGHASRLSGVLGDTGALPLSSINTADPEYPYLAQWLGGQSANAGPGVPPARGVVDGDQRAVVGSTTPFTDSFVIR